MLDESYYLNDNVLDDTIVVILSGGLGTRLDPLTKGRGKPGVPLVDEVRLIDFALSNAINSGARNIVVSVKHKPDSLEDHIKTWYYPFSQIPQHSLRLRYESEHTGTFDAIRAHWEHLRYGQDTDLILAGDHVYKMDYRIMKRWHDINKADLTISVAVVPKKKAFDLGVLQVDEDWNVVGFKEKSPDPVTIPGTDNCIVSMGIYMFNHPVTEECMELQGNDFARDIIPQMLEKHRVSAYNFTENNRISEWITEHTDRGIINRVAVSSDSSYWMDVGTLLAYWETVLGLTDTEPRFNLYTEIWPIHSLPHAPAKMNEQRLLVSNGVVITASRLYRCVIGPETRIEESSAFNSIFIGGERQGTQVRKTVLHNSAVRNLIADKGCIFEGARIGYYREEDIGNGLTVVDTEKTPTTGEYLVTAPNGFRLPRID